MPPTKHALLGASKAHQWLECTPSVMWEQKFVEPPSSEAAAEGTLAHAIAEEHLRRILAGKKVATSAKLKKDPLYKPSGAVLAPLLRLPGGSALKLEHVHLHPSVPRRHNTNQAYA